MIALWLACTLAAGDRLLAWLGPRLPDGVLRTSLAFAAGVVAPALLAGGLSLAGVPLAPWLPAAMGLPFLALSARARLRRPWPPGPRLPPAARWALGLAALFLAFATARTLWEPLTGWDARTVGGLQAALLYHHATLAAEPDPLLHPANPFLLVPLARWSLAGWMGRMEDHVSLVFFPLCFAAMLGVVHGSLARRLPPPAPSLLSALLAGTPLFWLPRDGSVQSGYADVPLTMLSAAFAAALLEGRRGLRLAALFGAGLMFTKLGGVLIVLVVLVLRHPLFFLAVPWLPGVPRLVEVGLREGGWLGPDLALWAFRHTFLAPWTWGLLPWIALLSRGPKSADRRFLGLLILLYGVSVWLYVLRCGLPGEALQAASLGRYLMPAAPWMVLYVGAGLRAPSGSGGAPPPRPAPA